MNARLVVAAALVALAPATARAQDFSGTWDVKGTDPTLGAFVGQAVVTKTASGYSFVRLVELANKLPDGRTLALSWEGSAQNDPQGLQASASLRRQEFVKRAGTLSRGPQDKVPLALSVVLKGSGGPIGAFGSPAHVEGTWSPGGPTERWDRSASAAPALPRRELRLDPFPQNALATKLYSLLFAKYRKLPVLAVYASRPEFQAAAHATVVETTGREWTRAHPDRLLVVQKVPDAITLVEEDLRAGAFRWKLSEKAARWDAEMVKDHVEGKTGMLGGALLSNGAHVVHGDSGLHQGSWVASQAWRFLATQDPQALANVELGTRALIMMCDAPNDPAQFARAVQETPFAPTNWLASTSLPGISYLEGGNNDMLHGVDYGFVMAERVLPAGHPLLAQIGARARTLALNNKNAKSGTHFFVLAGLAARLTGDPAVRSSYRKKLLWSPLEMLWMLYGEGITTLGETGGNSGRHLSTCTLVKVRQLGGAKPDLLERLWRKVAEAGTRRAFNGMKHARLGLLATVAGPLGANGAVQDSKDVLAELPYPRPAGDFEVDFSIDPDFCLSPYPAMFYKGDFMTNPGRQQSLRTYPLWTIGDSDNYWKQGPLDPWHGGPSGIRWSSQDYLHAYWYGRANGVIGASD